jgi:hypothetical protein
MMPEPATHSKQYRPLGARIAAEITSPLRGAALPPYIGDTKRAELVLLPPP